MWAYKSLVLLFSLVPLVRGIVKFSTEITKPRGNVKGLNFVGRHYLPYGPDFLKEASGDDTPYRGYAFGMGAGDEITYDSVNHYFYSKSDQGYIIVTDMADPSKPINTEFSFDMTEFEEVAFLQVCSPLGLLFIILEEEAQLLVYNALQRNNQQRITLNKTIDVDPLPAFLISNSNCSTVVVAHENDGEGEYGGSVTIVKKIDSDEPDVLAIPYTDAAWDDAYLLEKGLNMPLTEKSMEYWDEYSAIADELDLSEVRENYRPNLFLLPESLAWRDADESELLINMQPNNGLLRVDVVAGKLVDVAGYGLKDHSVTPIDLDSEDEDCDLKTYENVFALRNPDNINTVEYNGKTYVLTGNEGEGFEYEDFEDIITANELFDGSEFTLSGMTIPRRIFNPDNPASGSSYPFNSKCDGDGCVGDIELNIGSSAIDYESDPKNPIFHRLVLLGGRGWTIYEVPDDPTQLLKLVYDSADTVERGICETFPWAHNAFTEDTSSPIDLPNNTAYLFADDEFREEIEEYNDPEEEGCFDQGDGTPGACPLPETVDSQSGEAGPTTGFPLPGIACGRLINIVVSGANAVALLYDITDITSPDLLQVLHLSPESEFKSPGLAYNEGTLGEIELREFIFVTQEESPTGKPGVFFVGTASGTVSFYEFDCEEYDEEIKSASLSRSLSMFSLFVMLFGCLFFNF